MSQHQRFVGLVFAASLACSAVTACSAPHLPHPHIPRPHLPAFLQSQEHDHTAADDADATQAIDTTTITATPEVDDTTDRDSQPATTTITVTPDRPSRRPRDTAGSGSTGNAADTPNETETVVVTVNENSIPILGPTQDVYTEILNNPSLVPFHHPDPKRARAYGNQYTIADIDSDGRPELLLRMNATLNGAPDLGYVFVVSGTSSPGHIHVIDGFIANGAGRNTGYVSRTFRPAAGNTGIGMTVESSRPTSKQPTVDFTTIRNGQFVDLRPSIPLPASGNPPAGYCSIDWLPVSNPSLIISMMPPPC